MPIPVLKLSLVPPPTLWRRFHEPIGWAVLALGVIVLTLTGAFTWVTYSRAAAEGRAVARATGEARRLSRDQEAIVRELQGIDVTKELPRWRLAERYFSERTLRWSRLTAELERSLTRDVRLKSIQKVRGNDQQVQLKLRGEGRTREAEVVFIESLYQNLSFFPQILLERESERQGGGVDFDLTLAVNPVPGAYEKLVIPPPVYQDQSGNVLPASHPEVVKWLAKGGAKAEPSAPKPVQAPPKPAAPLKTAPPAPAPQAQPATPAPDPAAAPRRRPRRGTEGSPDAVLQDGSRPPEEPVRRTRPRREPESGNPPAGDPR